MDTVGVVMEKHYFNGRFIFKSLFFHCNVNFPGCSSAHFELVDKLDLGLVLSYGKYQDVFLQNGLFGPKRTCWEL